MSHHYSGPDWGFPHGDARLDLTDLYAFPKPGDAGKSILIMNVHPSVHDYLDRENPLGATTAEPFAPEAVYELKIDTDGDVVADIAYRVRFSSSNGGAQTATLRRVEGAEAAGTGDGGQILVEGAPVSTGWEARVTETGDYRFFAGWRSDPFFLDRRGAVSNLQFTGDDFFADKNVCGIVLEVPNSALGPKEFGLWARTLDSTGGGWVQADRGALPAQAIFLTGAERGAYLAGDPADDSRFVAVFAHSLEHAGGYTPEEAKRVARTLLPEMLFYDPSRPARFPVNGRTLTDDVVDSFLALLTNGKVTRDGVGPHRDLLSEFPYLGPPHNITSSAISIRPPFTLETVIAKVRAAEDAWNSRDPVRVSLAYSIDSIWRNRDQFLSGRRQIQEFLAGKWQRELDYRLTKALWAFDERRIAVRFQYEWHNDSGQWFRSYGNELWEFDDDGLMRRREASINDVAIAETDRKFFWPAPGPRPTSHPGILNVE